MIKTSRRFAAYNSKNQTTNIIIGPVKATRIPAPIPDP
jgi:hypothetical protein